MSLPGSPNAPDRPENAASTHPLEHKVLAAVRQHAREGLLPSAAAFAGLAPAEFMRLAATVQAPTDEHEDSGAPDPAGDRPELLTALIDLIWAHRTTDAAWTRLMAGTIASAAFGPRHLWQDLGATGRIEVTTLMERHFTSLARRNVRDLKWKNHLFQCLGAELNQPDLRPPRCDACDERSKCFPAAAIPVKLVKAGELPTSLDVATVTPAMR